MLMEAISQFIQGKVLYSLWSILLETLVLYSVTMVSLPPSNWTFLFSISPFRGL
jgi:hypothetical protein